MFKKLILLIGTKKKYIFQTIDLNVSKIINY